VTRLVTLIGSPQNIINLTRTELQTRTHTEFLKLTQKQFLTSTFELMLDRVLLSLNQQTTKSCLVITMYH